MPAKKPTKKTVKKIEKDAVKLAEKPVYNIPEELPTPEIEFVLKAVTKYDLNWFYLKKIFTNFEKWLMSPYRRYEKWFNLTFNTQKIICVPSDIPPPKTPEELIKLKENKVVIKWKGKKEKTLSDIIYESEK